GGRPQAASLVRGDTLRNASREDTPSRQCAAIDAGGRLPKVPRNSLIRADASNAQPWRNSQLQARPTCVTSAAAK
ncbi:MAG: hypothetical protein OXH93_01965, partial [Caldilineaceae bacterium]|nr:hypothetical protein [Caldilineaceae bacterium]